MAGLADWLLTHSLKGEIGNELATFSEGGVLSPAQRYEQVRKAALDFGANLVFLDNAAHVFPGNENARHDVAAFLGLLERLSIEIDGAVVLLAHPNKAHGQGAKQGNEYSGSTGWSAHVRNRLFLDWNSPEEGLAPDPDERVLRRSKANYASRGEEVVFRWHAWSFVRPDDLPEGMAAELAANVAANADNDLFLACLRERNRQSRPVSEKPSRSWAPSEFAKMPESKGIGKRRLEAAMDRLFRIGRIERAVLRRDTSKGRDIEGLREVAEAPPNPSP